MCYSLDLWERLNVSSLQYLSGKSNNSISLGPISRDWSWPLAGDIFVCPSFPQTLGIGVCNSQSNLSKALPWIGKVPHYPPRSVTSPSGTPTNTFCPQAEADSHAFCCLTLFWVRWGAKASVSSSPLFFCSNSSVRFPQSCCGSRINKTNTNFGGYPGEAVTLNAQISCFCPKQEAES